jgi:hypothetical protein
VQSSGNRFDQCRTQRVQARGGNDVPARDHHRLGECAADAKAEHAAIRTTMAVAMLACRAPATSQHRVDDDVRVVVEQTAKLMSHHQRQR